MFEHRDRAQLEVDRDLQSVLEFMQAKIPTNKLLGVAESLPQMARLLWGEFPQEPFQCAQLRQGAISVDRRPQAASESSPERKCADDDSAVVAVGLPRQ